MTKHDANIQKARKAVAGAPTKTHAIAGLRRGTDLTFFEAKTLVDAVTSDLGL